MNIEIVPKEYITKLNYHDALLYCSMMNIDGNDDWKLPTFAECRHIVPLLERYVYTHDMYWVNHDVNDESSRVYDLVFNRIHKLKETGEHSVCPIRYVY